MAQRILHQISSNVSKSPILKGNISLRSSSPQNENIINRKLGFFNAAATSIHPSKCQYLSHSSPTLLQSSNYPNLYEIRKQFHFVDEKDGQNVDEKDIQDAEKPQVELIQEEVIINKVENLNDEYWEKFTKSLEDTDYPNQSAKENLSNKHHIKNQLKTARPPGLQLNNQIINLLKTRSEYRRLDRHIDFEEVENLADTQYQTALRKAHIVGQKMNTDEYKIEIKPSRLPTKYYIKDEDMDLYNHINKILQPSNLHPFGIMGRTKETERPKSIRLVSKPKLKKTYNEEMEEPAKVKKSSRKAKRNKTDYREYNTLEPRGRSDEFLDQMKMLEPNYKPQKRHFLNSSHSTKNHNNAEILESQTDLKACTSIINGLKVLNPDYVSPAFQKIKNYDALVKSTVNLIKDYRSAVLGSSDYTLNNTLNNIIKEGRQRHVFHKISPAKKRPSTTSAKVEVGSKLDLQQIISMPPNSERGNNNTKRTEKIQVPWPSLSDRRKSKIHSGSTYARLNTSLPYIAREMKLSARNETILPKRPMEIFLPDARSFSTMPKKVTKSGTMADKVFKSKENIFVHTIPKFKFNNKEHNKSEARLNNVNSATDLKSTPKLSEMKTVQSTTQIQDNVPKSTNENTPRENVKSSKISTVGKYPKEKEYLYSPIQKKIIEKNVSLHKLSFLPPKSSKLYIVPLNPSNNLASVAKENLSLVASKITTVNNAQHEKLGTHKKIKKMQPLAASNKYLRQTEICPNINNLTNKCSNEHSAAITKISHSRIPKTVSATTKLNPSHDSIPVKLSCKASHIKTPNTNEIVDVVCLQNSKLKGIKANSLIPLEVNIASTSLKKSPQLFRKEILLLDHPLSKLQVETTEELLKTKRKIAHENSLGHNRVAASPASTNLVRLNVISENQLNTVSTEQLPGVDTSKSFCDIKEYFTNKSSGSNLNNDNIRNVSFNSNKCMYEPPSPFFNNIAKRKLCTNSTLLTIKDVAAIKSQFTPFVQPFCSKYDFPPTETKRVRIKRLKQRPGFDEDFPYTSNWKKYKICQTICERLDNLKMDVATNYEGRSRKKKLPLIKRSTCPCFEEDFAAKPVSKALTKGPPLRPGYIYDYFKKCRQTLCEVNKPYRADNIHQYEVKKKKLPVMYPIKRKFSTLHNNYKAMVVTPSKSTMNYTYEEIHTTASHLKQQTKKSNGNICKKQASVKSKKCSKTKIQDTKSKIPCLSHLATSRKVKQNDRSISPYLSYSEHKLTKANTEPPILQSEMTPEYLQPNCPLLSSSFAMEPPTTYVLTMGMRSGENFTKISKPGINELNNFAFATVYASQNKLAAKEECDSISLIDAESNSAQPGASTSKSSNRKIISASTASQKPAELSKELINIAHNLPVTQIAQTCSTDHCNKESSVSNTLSENDRLVNEKNTVDHNSSVSSSNAIVPCNEAINKECGNNQSSSLWNRVTNYFKMNLNFMALQGDEMKRRYENDHLLLCSGGEESSLHRENEQPFQYDAILESLQDRGNISMMEESIRDYETSSKFTKFSIEGNQELLRKKMHFNTFTIQSREYSNRSPKTPNDLLEYFNKIQKERASNIDEEELTNNILSAIKVGMEVIKKSELTHNADSYTDIFRQLDSVSKSELQSIGCHQDITTPSETRKTNLHDEENTHLVSSIHEICKNVCDIQNCNVLEYEESERKKTEDLQKVLDEVLKGHA